MNVCNDILLEGEIVLVMNDDGKWDFTAKVLEHELETDMVIVEHVAGYARVTRSLLMRKN